MEDTATSSPPIQPLRFRGNYYDNLMPWQAVGNSARFQIKPAPVPWKGIIFLNILYVTFFSGFFYLGIHYGKPDDRIFLFISVIGIGAMTCIGVTALTLHRFRGGDPWLIYDAGTQTITLPREKKSFSAANARLQFLYLTSSHSSGGGSELQLAVNSPTAPQTYLLLTSVFRPTTYPTASAVFDPILRSAKKFTPLEIICVAMSDYHTVEEQRSYEPK